MIIDIEQINKSLRISYVSPSGGIKIENIPVPVSEQYNWQISERNPDPNYISWDGKPVRKTKSEWLSRYRIEEFLSSQPDNIKNRLYTFNRPDIYFCDIEVEVTDDGFPHPHLAKNKITAIAYCNKDHVNVLGIRQLSSQDIEKIEHDINLHFKEYVPIKFTYRYFESEYDMLYEFFHRSIQKMPLLTGWNFLGFDWPYLVNRCKHLNIDPSIASPSNKLVGKQELPLHRIIVDYLKIYKVWDRSVDIKENNSLDFVSLAVLKKQKIKYNGTLQDLYENDFPKYIFYNAVDTLLVQHIHEKLLTLETFFMLANSLKVEIQKAFSPIWMTESAMAREFYKRNRVFPKNDDNRKKRESYEGAYVFTPVPGIYDYVASFDFASLYPSIMRQWNMSPENYIKDTSNIDEEFLCKSVSTACFGKKHDSVFKTILTEYYNLRKQAKNTMEEIETDISILQKYLD